MPFTRLCIHAPGDLACPSEDYSRKILSYEKVKEARACADCSVAGVLKATCGDFFATATGCPSDIPTSPSAPIFAGHATSCQSTSRDFLDIKLLSPDAGCTPAVPAR